METPVQTRNDLKPQLGPVAANLSQTGEATAMKITLIGRPGRIVEKGQVVLTSMQGAKAPSLPKGLPAPPAEATPYIVYIAAKQWRKVGPGHAESAGQADYRGLSGAG